jgi:hypothetical protein
MKDQNRSTRIRHFNISDVAADDLVRIKAYKDPQTGNLVASQFRRREVGSSENAIELRGLLEAIETEHVIVSGIVVRPPGGSGGFTDQDLGESVMVEGAYDRALEAVVATRVEITQ